MNKIISDITDFIFVEDDPQKSDIIICVGGSHPQIGEKAAELYKSGYAPKVLVGGKYSVKTGAFPGVREKADIYDGDYTTESDFYADVLIKNGVPDDAVIKENESGFTRENADFARVLTDKLGMEVHKAIVVCKSFHARRCLMFFQSAFDSADILIVPAEGTAGDRYPSRENWYKTDEGIKRVLGEIMRCGNQINGDDIRKFAGNI